MTIKKNKKKRAKLNYGLSSDWKNNNAIDTHSKYGDLSKRFMHFEVGARSTLESSRGRDNFHEFS